MKESADGPSSSLTEQVDSVARYYDEWTDKYLDVFGDTIQAHRPTDQTDLHRYLLESIGVRDGQRVLDAGCGVCGPSVHFARHRDLRVDALTISDTQARRAADHVAAHGLTDRIRITVGDFHDLEALYPREHFDSVYFLESLSHSPDPARVLAGAFAVLKPGGSIYVKDFFIRPCAEEPRRSRMMAVIAKVDRLFAVKTARAEEIFAHLWQLGFLPEFVRPPNFHVDNTRWQAFDNRHAFDLFDGGPSFDWSQWLEFRFRKP